MNNSFGLDGIFVLSGAVSLLGITDGTSNTILFGEKYNYDPNWPAYQAAIPNFQNVSLCAISQWGTYLDTGGSGYYGLNSSPLAPIGPGVTANALQHPYTKGVRVTGC